MSRKTARSPAFARPHSAPAHSIGAAAAAVPEGAENAAARRAERPAARNNLRFPFKKKRRDQAEK